MKRLVIHAPSIGNCNTLTVGKEIGEMIAGGMNFFHVDLMDGNYVPNMCFPVRIVSDIKKAFPNTIIDVHLMVTNPMNYLDSLQKAGADYVCFHVDNTNFVRRGINSIRDLGMKPGVVINPSQRIDILEPYITMVDMVLFMAVEPGIFGQRLFPDSQERIQELTALRKRKNAEFLISVDGGVTRENCRDIILAGADIIVGNIYTVFNQPEGLTAACNNFNKLLEEITG